MRTAVLASFAAVAAAQQNLPCPAVPAGQTPCCFQTQAATYDLTARAQATMQVNDNRNNNAGSDPVYTYYFNLCHNAPPPNATLCPSKANTPAAAWQVGTANVGIDSCYSLGANSASCPASGCTPNTPNVQFRAHPWNPASGYMVSFTGGDSIGCPTQSGGTLYSRGFDISVRCADINGMNPQNAYDMVIEDTTCTYYAVVYDRTACPLQCGRGNGGYLCSSLGVCDYDAQLGAARCFCNAGFTGSNCGTPGGSTPEVKTWGSNIAGGFFGGIFTGLAVMLFVFYMQGRKSGESLGQSIRFENVPFCGKKSSGSSGSSARADYAAAYSGADVGGYKPPTADGDGPLLLSA